ncbi:MAG TPA: diguanylate cyclase, partial [Thermoplasmata archaeon]|nr:diguanylate cyclase [Thermoplasmata archaeon]
MALGRHGELAARTGMPLSVAILDLDHFKRVNDTCGHAAGDAALAAFAGVLRRNTRRMNLSARFGGEEFVTVLLDGDIAGAVRFAERVVAETRALRLASGPLTASAGVATYEEGMGSHEVLVATADRALYAAKGDGRDRVAVAERFPAPAGTGPGGAGAPAAAPVLEMGGSESVLVIDDDVRNIFAITSVLERHRMEVSYAEDGKRGIEPLREARPDVVLMDDM